MIRKKFAVTNLWFLLLFFIAGAGQASEFVNQLKQLAFQQRVEEAQALLEERRASINSPTPEWLAAVSWVGRGASFAERWELAEKYAREAFEGSEKLLAERALDDGPYLPTALGASIEVLGKVYDQRDRRTAVDFLRRQLEKYRGTSIETRTQKNLLLLSLEGRSFPGLDVPEFIGKRPPDSAELQGNVVLYYFWAHWCSDCKIQKPILERLHSEYGDRGLVIVGPTRLYGYIAGGEDADPEQELAYLRGAYQEKYPIPSWMAVPVSAKNFVNFGVSTTPTLVLADRGGVVRLYHPGRMPYEELRGKIESLLAAETD